jgi:hypothetical protein
MGFGGGKGGFSLLADDRGAANPFLALVMEIDTTQTGSATNTFILPCDNVGTYNALIEWGDGSFSTITSFNDADLTHVYSINGIYSIRITGSLPHIRFNDVGDKEKVLDIKQWGLQTEWLSFSQSFFGCSNLEVTASDTPKLSSVTTLNSMFRECTSLTGATANWDWDTSNILNMDQLFRDTAIGSIGIENWDVANANDFRNMFRLCSTFNTDISGWDVSGVSQFNAMFNGATIFNQPIGAWTTTSMTNIGNMLAVATAFDQDLSNWDTSLVTTANDTFRGGIFDQDISSWDVSNVATFNNFLLTTPFSTANYDLLLVAWNALTLQNGVPFTANLTQYTAGIVDSGTTDGTTALKLVDSTQNFLTTVSMGDVVNNQTDNAYAIVTNVDSDTVLSISVDIMVTGKVYTIETSAVAQAKANMSISDAWVFNDGGPI